MSDKTMNPEPRSFDEWKCKACGGDTRMNEHLPECAELRAEAAFDDVREALKVCQWPSDFAAADFTTWGPIAGQYIATILNAAPDLLAAIRSRDEEVRSWSLALQSLTPGGSEFVDDPARCVAFVRDTRESQHAAIVKLKRSRDEEVERLSGERDSWKHTALRADESNQVAIKRIHELSAQRDAALSRIESLTVENEMLAQDLADRGACLERAESELTEAKKRIEELERAAAGHC